MTSTPVPHSGCYWVVPGKFLAGNYPGEKEATKARLKLGGILDHGVRTFINLMQPDDRNHSGLPFMPYADIADALASEQGFTVTHQAFPIQDQGIPDTKTMDAVLEAIDANLQQDRPVYLHCWGGHGRTGTVVGCYLIAHGLATKDNFVEVIALLRKHVPTHIPSPENSKQRDFVRAYNAPRASAPDTAEADRFLGCLLGLAVGDAVGTTLEFKAPGSFKPIDDMVGGGPFGLEPGQWTDDTSMALCLAESLIECNGFDAIDQLTRYRRWYKEGHLSAKGHCFDIGNATRGALDEFGRTGDPWCGSTSPNSAGNGSLMRLSPIPMAFAGRPKEMLRHAADSSRTTHGALEAIDACRYYAGLLLGALRGESKETLLAPFYCPIPDYWKQNPLAPKIHEVAAGSYLTKEPPQIKGSGYVVQALEGALWAFHKSSNFHDGCLLAANLGDDADTTAAIYGQIAGAYYGAEGIPAAWREMLYKRELIEDYARRLHAMSYPEDSITPTQASPDTSPLTESEILCYCALRMDGYKYAEKMKVHTSHYYDKLNKVGIEGLSDLERMTVFFAMQRHLFKWGGEFTAQESRIWKQFRELFFSVVFCKVPQKYSGPEDIQQGWADRFEPRIEECIAVVKKAHEDTNYLQRNAHVFEEMPFNTYPSIKALVLDFVQHHEGKVDYAALTKEVLHHFPESKWKPTHWSYWRYQILHSALAGQFTPEALANLKVGVQKAPSIIPPELPKPTWPNLIELEQHNIAKALARVTHHMHPKVIARIREINADLAERARLEAILPECVEREAWLQPGSACIFPSVRRFVGRVKKKQLLKYVPKEGCIIDDNRFPRNLWTFLAIGEHYTGPNWKSSGLSAFELAHIFSHKYGKQELEWEVFKDHNKEQKPYSLFTCASNVVLIPKGFAKPTDGLPAVRVAFFKRHIELYGEESLPGLRGLDPEAIPGWCGDLEWNEPVLPPGWEENVEKLMEFRRERLTKLLGTKP